MKFGGHNLSYSNGCTETMSSGTQRQDDAYKKIDTSNSCRGRYMLYSTSVLQYPSKFCLAVPVS